jgi:hypothetical protein
MKLSTTRVPMFMVLLFASIPMMGCGSDGPELAEVSGVVSVDGKPVPGAVLTFVPTGGGSPSYGGTDKDGKYRLMFTDTKYGAMIGDHEVEIVTNKPSAAEIAEMKAEGQEVNVTFVSIPKQYKQKGALTAKVERKKNVVNFTLMTTE